MPPSGLPDAFLESGDEPLRDARRAVRARPRAVHDRARRTSASAATSSPSCARSSARSSSSAASCGRAEPSASGATPTSCAGCAAPRSPRCGKEVEPAEQAALGRFLPSWHGIDRRASLREALVPLQGLALPGRALGDRGAAAPRARTTGREQLDQLCASGEVVWVGAGLDRVAVYFREDAPVLGRPGGAAPPEGERARPDPRGARRAAPSSGSTSLAATGLEAEEALPALWDLVWAGEVTNDAWQPLRAGRRYGVPKPERRPRRFSRRRAPAITATQGRWSLDRAALRRAARSARARRAAARAAGDRHARRRPRRGHPRRLRRGLRRAAGARDARPLPARLLRRGARRRAVRARRRGRAAARAAAARGRRAGARSCSPPPIPAQPYGAALPWPKRAGGRAARVAGAQVVLLGGEPALFVERGGRSLVPLREPEEEWLRAALAALVDHVKRGGAQATRGRALRRRAGRRDRGHAAARRGRLPRRPAPRRAASLTIWPSSSAQPISRGFQVSGRRASGHPLESDATTEEEIIKPRTVLIVVVGAAAAGMVGVAWATIPAAVA